jgi:hypothetical protein
MQHACLSLFTPQVSQAALASSKVAHRLIAAGSSVVANEFLVPRVIASPNVPHGNKWGRLFVNVTLLCFAKVLGWNVYISFSGDQVKRPNIGSTLSEVFMFVHLC